MNRSVVGIIGGIAGLVALALVLKRSDNAGNLIKSVTNAYGQLYKDLSS
jgi:hypothetical protein